jgi:formylglycine-generating enzyme required for sulfatase activity
LRPNLLGLFDVHGNVGEWCHLEPAVEGLYDGLAAGYVVGLNGEPSGATRQAFRGGSYQNTPKRLRSAQRFFLPVGDRNSFFGFRIARTLPD